MKIIARKGTERSAPHSFVVVVENRRDPGFITLAPSRPRPGQSFLATLADEDGGVDSLEWEWTGGKKPGGVQGQVSLHGQRWLATAADVGQQIHVKTRYRDNFGRDSTEAVTETILDVPEAPPDFKASPGDRQVTLTWGEAANGGDPITHYETRYRRSDRQWSDTWSQVGGGAGARTRTISPLTNGQQYVFQVRAENGIGDGAAADTLATPVDPRPQILGPDTTRVGEGRHAGVVATFKVADTGRSVTWESLAGLDGAKFTLTRQVGVDTVLGLVEFKKAPDYEAPDDHDYDREYEVRIVARRGTLRSEAHDFVAVVENRDDPGTMTLSPSAPRVGETVTATLIDTDGGVRDTVWPWPRGGRGQRPVPVGPHVKGEGAQQRRGPAPAGPGGLHRQPWPGQGRGRHHRGGPGQHAERGRLADGLRRRPQRHPDLDGRQRATGPPSSATSTSRAVPRPGTP